MGEPLFVTFCVEDSIQLDVEILSFIIVSQFSSHIKSIIIFCTLIHFY